MIEIRKSKEHAPLIIPRSEHSVSRADVSKNALKVLYRLKDSGYEAFLVGGSVRDLLLGRHPKDFDVATDARPEEVRALFSNSRLIGRRFRLAHVRFGREIIEVATFRGTGLNDDSNQQQVIHESGRIISDNVYGGIEEDAWRRDFTVNALYYNIADYSVWDYAGGVADLKEHRLRLIGDPDRRYREDPVRMLRAARLAAKLDFEIDATAYPTPELAELIDGVPPARLFDEFMKMFQAGHALSSYRQLRELGLFEHLFPVTSAWLAAREDELGDGSEAELIEQVLINTDQRVASQKAVSPMFLFGVFLWGPIQERQQILMDQEGISADQALVAATGDVSREQAARIALPRRFSFPMREMLQLQPRFLNKKGRRALNLLNHRRFRAAYDFFVLRASAGEADVEIAEFWTEVQTMPASQLKRTFGVGRRRRRSSQRPRRPAPAN